MNKSPVRKSDLYKLEKGVTLFREGESSDYVYYVEKGCLEVFTKSKDQRIVLGRVMEGEFVGELGVLQNTARYASVVALQETHLKQHDQLQFIELISQEPDKSIRLLHSLSYRTRNVAVLGNEIAKRIADHESEMTLNLFNTIFNVIGSAFDYIKKLIYNREKSLYKKSLPTKLHNGIHRVKKGRVLFCEGHDSHYACRVVSGQFEVVKSLHDSFENIGIIEAGEYIGEIGLLEGTPRSLTVIAKQDAEVEVFDEDAFLQKVCTNFDNGFELIKSLSLRSAKLHQHLKELMDKHAEILDPSTQVQAKRLLQNIGDVSLLTGRMLERDMVTLQKALRQEANAVQDMVETYYRYIAGDANKEEMEQANAEFRNFLKTLGLGALLIIPGSFITIPLIVKMSKSLGIDLLPKSRLEVTDGNFD